MCVCVCVSVFLPYLPSVNAHGSYDIVICGLSGPDFSTLSHKRQDFRQKRVIEKKLCFDFLYNISEIFFIH